MAYKPNPYGMIRDKAYPSEIAAQRPICATRIHCEENPHQEPDARQESLERMEETEPSIRGTIRDNRVEMFNHALRSGHGFRNEGDE